MQNHIISVSSKWKISLNVARSLSSFCDVCSSSRAEHAYLGTIGTFGSPHQLTTRTEAINRRRAAAPGQRSATQSSGRCCS